MKVLIIGGGNMGLTFAEGFLRSHLIDKENLHLLEKSDEQIKVLQSKGLVNVYKEIGSYISEIDLIILAVKPQDCLHLLEKLADQIDEQQLVLSIMAGVSLETLAEKLKTGKVIRSMPNLPAQVGSGMTVFTSSDEVTRVELVTVQNLLNSTGKTIYVEVEDMIDAATAMSGSGPAYIFYFMKAMIAAGIEMGFSQAESELLTSQTFKGALNLYYASNYSCEQWIAKVSSKGGTTEAAFQSLLDNKVENLFQKAMYQAFDRARALGGK